MSNLRLLSQFTSISAALAIATAAGAANTPEVEDNNNKSQAQLVAMACGDTITGNTTGTSTTVPGPASADYFRIRTTGNGALTLYTLTMTSGAAAPLQTMTLRGLTQTTGNINAGTDASFATATTVGTTKIIKWYGTGSSGAQQDMYVAITGTASSTTDYTLSLTCSTVTPITMAGGTLQPGNVSVRPDAATATALDTDWWVYDSTYSPIATFGHDDADETAISRSLGAGTYYIGLSNYNTANNQPSPADDTFRTGNVLDFPNVVAQSTTTNYPTANMTASDGVVTVTGTGSRANPFEVAWYSFTVASPTVPQGNGIATPSTAQITTSTLLTVTVSPAANPTSTGITVTGNLSAINGSSTQQFYDDGTHGDVTGNDNIFSFNANLPQPLSAGVVSLPFSVLDAQARSSSGSISLTLSAAPTGSCCIAGSCVSNLSAFNCAGQGGTYNGNGSDCNGATGPVFSSTASFPVSIPDFANNTPGTASVSVTIPSGSGTISNLGVRVGLTHTWMGDIIMTLSNGSNTVDLINRAGVPVSSTVGYNDNFVGQNVFLNTASADLWAVATNVTTHDLPTGTYHPSGAGSADRPSPSLDVFNGSSMAGTWTLTVSDNAGADTGTITAFQLFNVTPLSCGPVCGTADFDGDGDTGTDADIEAFFACLGGNCCATCFPGGADFDGDGDTGTDADIESFFRVLAGGNC